MSDKLVVHDDNNVQLPAGSCGTPSPIEPEIDKPPC